MPITFRPAPHNAIDQYNCELPDGDARKLLSNLRWKGQDVPEIDELLQSPLIPQTTSLSGPIGGFRQQKNGLVNTVVQAYNQHHALVLRPDDIWLCILTQFNLFVNGPGRAEQLRSLFVAHEGKKKLVVTAIGTRHTVDFGEMAKQMTRLVDENVVDPSLREWIMPDFETTTPNDIVVASVLMMATLSAYFSYGFGMYCGIPHVTLLGTRNDWERILARIEKLKEYGQETTAWYRLLKPVLSRFVRAFDEGYAESDENREFWQTVAHYSGGGSGPTYLSGWINAFCAFDGQGKWIGGDLVFDETEAVDESVLFNKPEEGWTKPQGVLILDGVRYHSVDTKDIPPSYAEVEVELDDHGQKFESALFAGLIGTVVGDSGLVTGERDGTLDQVNPAVGWSFFTLKKKQPK